MADTITDKQPYGAMVELTCRNHPDLSWHTKNISPIGCRKTFYDLMHVSATPIECDCSLHDLIPKE